MHKDSEATLVAFGSALRAARKELGLSQEQLADKAGLDRAYVGGIERGERNVSLLNIVRLALAAKVTPAELLCRPEFVDSLPDKDQSLVSQHSLSVSE